jgi:hypothetical protein
MYCKVQNSSRQPIFVYGARHAYDPTTLPTSLFVLSAGSQTPKRWDCKGVLVPSDHAAKQGMSIIRGAVALKYRDMRRINVDIVGELYLCPRNNGVLTSDQIDFMVPDLMYSELLRLPRHTVIV